MSNKLTSLTGFGEGDPKPEKGNKPMFESGKKYKYNEVASKWNAHMESKNAKSSALNKKMGKGSASGINAERKRQGYKPMDAKRTRIHEGMDKYL